MTHAIIFANRSEGYGFFERTPQFPEDYITAIYQICSRITIEHTGGTNRSALRYTPLKDRYLLSVIHRIQGGNADEQRSHYIVVNFLMDPADADRFFANHFVLSTHRVNALSEELLNQFRDQPLPASVGEFLYQPSDTAPEERSGTLDPVVLMSGALYCRQQSSRKQLFLQADSDPAWDIQSLLSKLPPFLRKELSFCTNVRSAEESQGVVINFCPALGQIMSRGFEGSEMSDKYCYFPGQTPSPQDTKNLNQGQALLTLVQRVPMFQLFSYCIFDWDTYLSLSDAANERLGLKQTLSMFPEDRVIAALTHVELTSKQLERLEKMAAKDSALKRELQSRIAMLTPAQPPAPPVMSAGAPPARGKAAPSKVSLLILDGLGLLLGVLLFLLAVTASPEVPGTRSELLGALALIFACLGIGFFARGLAERIVGGKK